MRTLTVLLLVCPPPIRGAAFVDSAAVSMSNISSGCETTFPPFCSDEICYGLVINHNEGKIFRLGCLSSLNVEQSLDCKSILNFSKNNSACIQTDLRKICCCNQTEQYCNSIWKPHTAFPEMTKVEILLLMTIVAGFLVVFYAIHSLLDITTKKLMFAAPCPASGKLMKVEQNFGIVKATILLVLCICLWYPVSPECQVHSEGVFEERYYFISQLASSVFVGLCYCLCPFLLFMLDMNRLRVMTTRAAIPRLPFSVASMGATSFSLVPLTLFIYQATSVSQQGQGEQYCKFRKKFTQIMLGGLLHGIYAATTIAQEALVLYITSNHHDEEILFKSPEKTMCVESIREQLKTAKSNTVIGHEEALRISPLPFILDGMKEGILSVENTSEVEWITVRVLVSSPNSYAIHPQRFIVPPKRCSTISIQTRTAAGQSISKESGLMLQWFAVGRSYPRIDARRLWQRPHIVPRNRWKFYVLPVYHETT